MKTLIRFMRSPYPRVMLAVIALACVLYLTTQPNNSRGITAIRNILPPTAWRDVVGHFGLMFALTGIIFVGFATRIRWEWALLLAVLVVLLVGTGSEYSQSMVRGRTFSLTDLLSNWLGVFVMGFSVSFFVTLKNSLRQSMPLAR